MATLHLICGLPSSGKTTYAHALAADTGGTVFSLDRWLITLFGRYDLDDVGHEEHTRRVLACRDLMWEAAAPLLARGADVILDDGFFFREHRSRYAERAKQLGVATEICLLDVPLATLRERLECRNAALPAFNFRIDASTLTAFVGLFEPPTSEEGSDVLVVRERQPKMIQ